jgi:hypothetical protein
MTTENANPFVLPGFGQSGDAAQNPVFAGMEMMRKAWQGMAGAGVSGLESAGMPIMSMEDLERRISELQAVESWLRLNLSMLSNTIQGMEIQKSTMATLRSFATQGMPEGFGVSPSGQTSKSADKGAASTKSSGDKASETQPYVQAAEDWWHLVQDQFQSLAAATAATLQTAQQGVAAVTGADSGGAPAKKRAAKSTKSTASARSGTRSAGKSPSKSPSQTAKSTRKTSTKRTAHRAS